MAQHNRTDRLSLEIQKAVADIIRYDINDPRLSKLCSIVNTELTNDLQHCKLFITIYGTEEEQKQSFAVIQQAKGFIRNQLASKVNMRRIPELHFVYDDSIAYSIHIGQLINKINSEKGE